MDPRKKNVNFLIPAIAEGKNPSVDTAMKDNIDNLVKVMATDFTFCKKVMDRINSADPEKDKINNFYNLCQDARDYLNSVAESNPELQQNITVAHLVAHSKVDARFFILNLAVGKDPILANDAKQFIDNLIKAMEVDADFCKKVIDRILQADPRKDAEFHKKAQAALGYINEVSKSNPGLKQNLGLSVKDKFLGSPPLPETELDSKKRFVELTEHILQKASQNPIVYTGTILAIQNLRTQSETAKSKDDWSVIAVNLKSLSKSIDDQLKSFAPEQKQTEERKPPRPGS